MTDISNIILSHFTEHPFELNLDRAVLYQPGKLDMKPKGLWLSDESDYGWKEWCIQEGFHWSHLEYETTFRIKDGSNVLHLQTHEDIEKFEVTFSSKVATELGLQRSRYIDWALVKADYAGILITPYQRHWDAFRIWHDSWDVSSGCFWNLGCLELVQESVKQPLPISS